MLLTFVEETINVIVTKRLMGKAFEGEGGRELCVRAEGQSEV
jgi:hypothetical protein